jgi:hypothetical protein
MTKKALSNALPLNSADLEIFNDMFDEPPTRQQIANILRWRRLKHQQA